MKKLLSCLLCIVLMFTFISVAFGAATPAKLKIYDIGSNEDLKQYKNEIESITFTKSAAGTNAANDSAPWDISADGDGRVLAWLEDSNGNGLYEAYITAGGDYIYANENSSYLFEGYSALTSINGMNLLITDDVRYMSNMFAGCTALTSIDLNNFGMRKAVTTEGMFANCKSLKEIKGLSKLDTSGVSVMREMFLGCESLTKLDLRTFDTSNVTDMSYMFYNCKKLVACDFGYVDTDISTDYVDDKEPSVFNTAKVEDMSFMFSGCQTLRKLNLNGFNTASLRTVQQMFYRCYNLESLDMSKWDFTLLSGENQALYKFVSDCRKLNSLYLHNIRGYNLDFYDFQEDFENVSGVKIYTLDKQFDKCTLWTSVLKYMKGSSIVYADHPVTKAILTFTLNNGVSYFSVSEVGAEDESEDFIFGDETRTYNVNSKLKIRLYGSYPEYTIYVNGSSKKILRDEAIYVIVKDDASVYAIGEGVSEDVVGDEDKNPEGDGQVANNFFGVFSILFNRIVDFFMKIFSFLKF